MPAQKKTNASNPRGRLWCLELYCDNENHLHILDVLKSYYQFLGILHDRDVYEEDNEDLGHIKGQLKKAHYHIILNFENARYKNALVKELNCEDNLIQKLTSFKSYVIYLTHRDYPLKAQYDYDEFFGPLKKEAIKQLGNTCEANQWFEICNFIESKQDVVTMKELNQFVIEYGYYSSYRRSASIIFKTLDEHNHKYLKQIYDESYKRKGGEK